jgi:hypothetical protein
MDPYLPLGMVLLAFIVVGKLSSLLIAAAFDRGCSIPEHFNFTGKGETTCKSELYDPESW